MPSRLLLSPNQRARFFALPSEGHDFIRHYTLYPDDMALIMGRRPPQNRLGFAAQLCLMRYTGRTLGPAEWPSGSLIVFIAEQLGLHHKMINDYVRGKKQVLYIDTIAVARLQV